MKKFNVHAYLQTDRTLQTNNIILLSLLHNAALKVTEVWCFFVFSLLLFGEMLTKFTSKNWLGIIYRCLLFPSLGENCFLVDYQISNKCEWSRYYPSFYLFPPKPNFACSISNELIIPFQMHCHHFSQFSHARKKSNLKYFLIPKTENFPKIQRHNHFIFSLILISMTWLSLYKQSSLIKNIQKWQPIDIYKRVSICQGKKRKGSL